jgi:hypothetical protein
LESGLPSPKDQLYLYGVDPPNTLLLNCRVSEFEQEPPGVLFANARTGEAGPIATTVNAVVAGLPSGRVAVSTVR